VGVAFWCLAREIKGRKGLYGLRRIDPVKKRHQLEEEAARMLRLLGVGERCVRLDLSSIRALHPVMRRLLLGVRETRVLWGSQFFVMCSCVLAWLGSEYRAVQGLCLACSIRCKGVAIKTFAISVMYCTSTLA
jgi:hypothetical protein